jgi:hypothetical protein
MTRIVGCKAADVHAARDPSDGRDGDGRSLFVWKCPAVWKRFHATGATFTSLVAASSATNWCSQEMKQKRVTCASLEHESNDDSQCCIGLLDLGGHSCSFDARTGGNVSSHRLNLCTISHLLFQAPMILW